MNANEPRRILLTGCTRGLGRALLDQFVEKGHVVVGCGRTKDKVDRLTREFGSPHRFDVVDVADHRSVEKWARSVLESHGAPDLLINNAAIINQTRPLWQISVDEFSELIDINIKGTFHVLRAFLPAMVDLQRGVVVNLSSGWGRSVDAEVAPYCASKWGIEGLTLALAEELPEGMAAIPLNPGVIDTDMLRSCWGNAAAQAHRPAEWARVAANLLLKLGPADNGQQLAVSLNS